LALTPRDPDSGSDKKKKIEDARQDVFMREVDEALRQDELAGFFERYGKPLIAAVVLGLAAFGGYLWWQDDQLQKAQKRGEDFIIALDDIEANRLAEADAKLNALASEGSSGSAVSAKLLRAGIALEQERTKDAVRLYAEVAADSDAPQPYRDLATVREVAANFDNMKPELVIARLKPLAVPGKPWFGVAGELVGMAYLKQGKKDLAGPLFGKIAKDEELPETLRQRARQLASSLGVDAVDDVVEDKPAVRQPGAATAEGDDA
jgi:hypothetical protein